MADKVTPEGPVGSPVEVPVRPLPAWDAPGVQEVYAILCSDDAPPDGEHWEGFAARRIVAALSQSHEQALSVALADAQMVNDRLREALQAMVDCSHTMDVHCCARASQLAAAALKA